MEVKEDVERGGYCFLDGIGLKSGFLEWNMSESPLEEARGPETKSSAFQIRLGGCKGVVVVWPEHHLRGRELILRKRMEQVQQS
jgi:RNA-dependent RNA polymerase